MRAWLQRTGAAVWCALRQLATTRDGWRHLAAALALLIVIGGAGALLFVWAGLSPIAASAGHLPITRELLTFAMRNAVELRAGGETVPPLGNDDLILRGAGHYAAHCAICHGAPGVKPALVMQNMVPHPPRLPAELRPWTAEELFWIVRNGIKFTAMPAWPALQRDDEVWAMVAFLERLPALSPVGYRTLIGEQALIGGQALADGTDASASFDASALKQLPPGLRELVSGCAGCHGIDGNGRGDAFPRLAGQSRDYLLAALTAYAAGTRHSGFMQAAAHPLSLDEREALADYFAAQQRSDGARGNTADAEAVARGQQLATSGVPERGIPSCADCHGPTQQSRNPNYPLLAGQPAAYLEQQLKLFKAGHRGGGPFAPIMATIAKRLDERQMADAAAFYSSLPFSTPEISARR